MLTPTLQPVLVLRGGTGRVWGAQQGCAGVCMEVVTVVGASGDHGGLWEVVVVFGRLLWVQGEVVVVFRGSDASRVGQSNPAVGRAE